jgi:hypothetical protein
MDGLLNPSIPGPNIGATDGAAVQEADVQLLFRLDLPLMVKAGGVVEIQGGSCPWKLLIWDYISN